MAHYIVGRDTEKTFTQVREDLRTARATAILAAHDGVAPECGGCGTELPLDDTGCRSHAAEAAEFAAAGMYGRV